MKQAKTTRKSTATTQVKRVVATIALATAAGTAAAPAIAAEAKTDRGDDGIGRALGLDRAGAKFGGAERGVKVKEDGTVEVRAARSVLGGVGDAVSGVAGGAKGVVKGVVEDVADEPADVVEDVTDKVADVTAPVTDVVEKAAGTASDAVVDAVRPGKAGQGDAPGKGKGQGSGATDARGYEKASGSDKTGPGTSGEKGSGDKGSGKSGEKGSGKQAQGESGGAAGLLDPVDIDYSFSPDRGERSPEQPAADAEDDVSGELHAFRATAQALGFGAAAVSAVDEASAQAERADEYEPRHMKPASRGGERPAIDTRRAAGDTGVAIGSSDLLASIGVGDVDLTVAASPTGVDVRVGAAGVRADVKAEPEGVTLEAGVQGGVADVAVGADGQGVEASAGVAGVVGVDTGAAVSGTGARLTAEVGVAGKTASVTGEARAAGRASAREVGPIGVPQAAPGLAGSGAGVFQDSARAYLDPHARDAVSDGRAEFLSYQPTAVDRVAEEADAATREAIIDAPLRVATTGTEAAALTGLAGALVVGGAGALLVANRSRAGEPVPATASTTTTS